MREYKEDILPFYQYLVVPTIIDLKSEDKVDALKELAQTLCRTLKIRKQKPVIEEMLKREEAASTFIGQGLAIPTTRGSIKDDFAIIVGRSIKGINYDAARGALAHLVVLVMSKEADDNRHIELRSEIASFFKSEIIKERLLADSNPVDIVDLVASYKKGTTRIIVPEPKSTAKTRKKSAHPVIASALSLLKELKAEAIVFLADAVEENDFLDAIRTKKKVIIVTSDKSRFEKDDKRFTDLIQAPPFPTSRTGQIKIGILLAISRTLIKKTDKVVCVSGSSTIGVFDTVIALDVEKEFQFFLSATRTILPPDVKPEVLERVLGLASEIAVEGREGKPMGTIFVVGDTNSVNVYVRQLIINPFRGYSEAERNILDPGLDETIKEFSSIDGAFIITGDGIVLSAGSYLRPPADADDISGLPSGFGARHAAAAGITTCSNALAITVSESTGMVSIFKNGSIMLSLAKPVTRSKSSIKLQDGLSIDH